MWIGHLLGNMLSQAEMMALLHMMVLERWIGVDGDSRGSRCSSLAGRRTRGGEGQEDGMALGRNDGNLLGARCLSINMLKKPENWFFFTENWQKRVLNLRNYQIKGPGLATG